MTTEKLIFGRSMQDWIDIYCLARSPDSWPGSFADLITWESPRSPQECLELSLALVQAREKYRSEAVAILEKWIQNLESAGFKGKDKF